MVYIYTSKNNILFNITSIQTKDYITCSSPFFNLVNNSIVKNFPIFFFKKPYKNTIQCSHKNNMSYIQNCKH